MTPTRSCESIHSECSKLLCAGARVSHLHVVITRFRPKRVFLVQPESEWILMIFILQHVVLHNAALQGQSCAGLLFTVIHIHQLIYCCRFHTWVLFTFMWDLQLVHKQASVSAPTRHTFTSQSGRVRNSVLIMVTDGWKAQKRECKAFISSPRRLVHICLVRLSTNQRLCACKYLNKLILWAPF